EKAAAADEFLAWRVPSIVRNAPQATQLWLDLANHLANQGVAVAFLFAPTDPAFDRVEAVLRSTMDTAFNRLVERFPVIDLRNSAELVREDFYDLHHLVASGRQKLHPLLIDQLVRTLGCAKTAS